MKYFIAGVFGIAVDSVMVVILYLVRRRVGAAATMMMMLLFAEGRMRVVRKYTRIY